MNPQRYIYIYKLGDQEADAFETTLVPPSMGDVLHLHNIFKEVDPGRYIVRKVETGRGHNSDKITAHITVDVYQ